MAKIAFFVLFVALAIAEDVQINPEWSNETATWKTTITHQVVVNPLLVRGNPVHDASWNSMKETKSNLVRFVPWFPYPRYAVAAMKAPTSSQTFWNFTLLDPLVDDFMKAAEGRDVIINFSTTPSWMWNGPQPDVPADPNQVFWGYNTGTQLVNDDFARLGEYYGRLVSWYTNGGFIDELGKYQKSGHYYKITHWEILNEIEAEHNMNPQYYTKIYDAIAGAIKKVQPKMKFVGMALAYHNEWNWYNYFLDPKNHAVGTPIDYISFHFYASPASRTTLKDYLAFFTQVDGFVTEVETVLKIKNTLNPQVKLDIDEIGVILPNDNNGPAFGPDIPSAYWNANGAMFAYLVGNLANRGVDVLGQSQLTGYPTQFPSVSLVDWNTGTPNARLRVQQLLQKFFRMGDSLLKTSSSNGDVYALAFDRKTGEKFALIVNKANNDVGIAVAGCNKGILYYVDQTTKGNPYATSKVGASFKMGGWSVGILQILA